MNLKTLDAELRRIVLGDCDPAMAEARVRFFAEVMAGEPETGGAITVWPGAGRAATQELVRLVMRAFGQLPASRVRARLTSLKVEAAGRLRAQDGRGTDLRVGSGRVEAEPPRTGYAGFFGLDVLHLRHQRFDGSLTPWLTREVFVAGDAVTVLPYDPIRDRVLLIEQLRVGPFGRGDPVPWQLEAIAGRIDPGEAPEAAARREAVEEAGLTLGRLEKVAEYYPTPGAVTEYLYSYVALCDLPDGIAGVFGAAEEAEDIKGHLVSFDRLIEVMASGEISNAPLLLTVLWLQRERVRLRSAA